MLEKCWCTDCKKLKLKIVYKLLSVKYVSEQLKSLPHCDCHSIVYSIYKLFEL